MSTISWKRILDSNRIEYIEKGSSVAKGNIAIHCPFCGNADPSFHMGLNLTNGFWGCWRNTSHRGRSPVRLLTILLNISYASAREMAGLDDSYVDPDGYEAIKHALFKKPDAPSTKDLFTLQFPEEFETLSTSRARLNRFVSYLVSRGFPLDDIPRVIRRYHLKAAISGDFKDRIILPYYMGRDLVTWTGRAITASSLRYLDLSIADSKIPAKETLYNYNATLRGGRILLVAEGPFDAIKLDFYGLDQGVRCVALSKNDSTEAQMYLLEEVSVNFGKVLTLMDNGGGVLDSYKLKEKLSQIKNIGYTRVPNGFKDGGEMPPKRIMRFCQEMMV